MTFRRHDFKEMIEKLSWFLVALQLRGSVAIIIFPRILLFAGFSFLISIMDYFGLPIALQLLGDLTTNVVYNLVLGLLLVFRTNTAYERFWEGRKAWGTLVVNLRNLAREIQIGIPELDPTDWQEKKSALQHLVAFAIATKLHLRQEPIDELQAKVSSVELDSLRKAKSPPLEITFWLADYLQQQFLKGRIDNCRVITLNTQLNDLVEGLTNCERILKTPVPLAYSIYLKRLILIYCLLLPFHLVAVFHGWAVLIVSIISFILLGVEEVGNELENPFGKDPNDLPLDEICDTVLDNIEQTIAFNSSDRASLAVE